MLKTDALMRPACGLLPSVAGRNLALSLMPRTGYVTRDLARCIVQIRMLPCLVLPQGRIGDVTDHAIVVADTDGTITWWSPGAEILFGHSTAAALGQSLDLIVPDALRARHWAGFQRAMEAPQVKDLAADMPVLCGDGRVREFAGRLMVLSDGLGVALGAVGIFAADGTTGIKPFG